MKSPRQQVVEACPECGTRADVTAHEPFTKVTCPGCGKPFRARTEFDHFVITEQIGTGGMSRVFRAKDTSLQRDVALKILNKACSQDGKRVRQFEKEAEITAKISHPNVVRVFTAGRDQAYFYIAMELVSGGSLEGIIRERAKMGEAQVLEMAIHAVQGLKAAKEAGLIHRDIKPGNILFSEDGTPKIVDFGLAIFARDSDGSGEIWATPYYVPPETLRHEPEDFRSDIYSLGATLYHALVGKPPCDKDTSSLEELKVLKAKTIHLKPAVHKLSRETCAVLERALAIRPADRYRSYDEFLDHLKYAQRFLRRGGKGKPWPGRRPKGLKAWQWSAAAAALMAAAGVLIWRAGKKEAPPVSGSGGSLVTDADPIAGSGESTSARFLNARGLMLNAKFSEAYRLFDELGDSAATVQPTRHWARFNAGICALFLGDTEGARDIYSVIAGEPLYSTSQESAELARFFSDTSRWLAAVGSVPTARMADCPANSVRAIGLLAAGLKNWHAGDTASAAEFLRAFAAASPPASADWVADCKPLIQGHLADAAVIAALPGSDVSKLSVAEAEGVLVSARNAVATLAAGGAPKEKAAAAVEALAASVAKLHEQLAKAGQVDSRRVNSELKLIHDTNAAAAALGENYRFAEAAAKLKALTVTTPEASSAREAHLDTWQKATAFLEQISRDLVQPVAGVIEQGGGVVRAVWSFSSGMLSAKPAQGTETRMPLAKVAPGRLVELADDILKRISDSDEYYRRSELMYCFALRAGLNATAKTCGETLAGELAGFREKLSLLNLVEVVSDAGLSEPK